MKIIEVDCDGVLADIHGALGYAVKDIVSGFDGDRDICSWGMKELDNVNKNLRSRIFALFKSEEFISRIKVYKGVLNGLRIIASKKRYKLVINTNLSSKEVVEARSIWLEKLKNSAGIDFEAIISYGENKKMLNSDVIIEDNVQNLKLSPAPIKILIRRGHNRGATLADLGRFKRAVIVSSFEDAAVYLDKILN